MKIEVFRHINFKNFFKLWVILIHSIDRFSAQHFLDVFINFDTSLFYFKLGQFIVQDSLVRRIVPGIELECELLEQCYKLFATEFVLFSLISFARV